MYVSYVDDGGSDRPSPIALVGAVIIEDKFFDSIETIAGIVIEDVIPEAKLEKFQEFHADDLYGGHGIFEGCPEPERFQAIRGLLSSVQHFQLPVIYSAVDKNSLAQHAYGGLNALDLAFRMCALGIEQWITKKDPSKLGLLIMDETKDASLKHAFKAGFKALRGTMRPPDFKPRRLSHFHDGMYFGDSKDSVGIQIADLCNYFLLRHLNQHEDKEDFLSIYRRELLCSKAQPEWGQIEHIFCEHSEGV